MQSLINGIYGGKFRFESVHGEEAAVPSSANRKRLEVPDYLHERLVEIAADESRTLASVAQELIMLGLSQYQSRRFPTDRADELTTHARRALVFAQDEAGRFNHHYLGTEHLFLGLLCAREGVAAQALQQFDIDYEQARDAVHYYVGNGVGRPPRILPWIPRARRVFKLAGEEAGRAGSVSIGTAHLLLALLEVRDGMGARVLAHLGIVDGVRDVLIETVRAAAVSDGESTHPYASTCDHPPTRS